jgi:VanZ family protein
MWLPVVGWGAVIFAFSSVPDLSTGLGGWDTVLRKGAHMTEYAVLGALLYRALAHEVPALATGIAYAATDELHQHFVRGRSASPLDVAIDAVGIALGMLVWLRLQRR